MFGIVAGILIYIIVAIVQLALFLLRRFDVANSIIFSIIIQLLTRHQDWSKEIRWGIFLGLILLFYILQHQFKIVMVMFTIISVLIGGIMGYILADISDPIHLKYVKGIIFMIVVLFLNITSWVVPKEKLE